MASYIELIILFSEITWRKNYSENYNQSGRNVCIKNNESSCRYSNFCCFPRKLFFALCEQWGPGPGKMTIQTGTYVDGKWIKKIFDSYKIEVNRYAIKEKTAEGLLIELNMN